MHDFKLYIEDIRQQRGAEKGVALKLEIGEIELRGQKVDVGTVEVQGKATNIDEGIILSAVAKGRLILACSRCLDKFEHPLNLKLEEFYSYEHTEEAEYFVEDSYIEVESLIVESIALNLDIKTLCKKDCAGLCPSCGINLNKDPCNCKSEPIDIRWHKLEELRKKMDES